MSKKPPCRPGIIFEVGARIEAQDYLQKWYPSRIEKIDYDEGKMLVHFDRWSHRYDEWIFWDSNRLRPLERPAVRKEGLKEEEEMSERLSEMRTSRPPELPGCTESTEDQTELPQPRQELRDGEEVLARWTDCRYYPAKIETVNKEGTYTVQFYDGVIRCVKRIHIKSMPEDAKGQDWIALVKAANAAAKSRGGCRPRTSLNSNKNKDEHMSDCEEPDKLEEEEDPESERLDTVSAGEDDFKSEFDQHEMDKGKKRRRQSSVCNSKRPRLKQTGCSEEEVDCKSEQKEVSVTTQQRPVNSMVSAAEEKAVDTPVALSTPSPGRLRTRRLKHDSGESSSSQRQGSEEGEASHSPASSLGLTDGLHTDKDAGSSEKKEASPHNTQPLAASALAPSSPSLGSTMASATGKVVDGQVANRIQMVEKSPLPVSAVAPKATVRTPKANKHAREPIMNTKRSEDPTSLNECIDLDHNKFKCQIPGCSKAFRKAKLLDYHLKYYHNTEKEHEAGIGSPDRVGRTRATSASMPTSTMLEVPDHKRRRTVSTSSSLSSQSHSLQLEYSGGCLKPSKFCKKKRSSTSVSSDSTEVSLPLTSREKAFESLHDKILKKVIEKDTGLCIKTEKKCQVIGRKKEKDKERKDRKEKDPFKLKQKKKKKKKKKSRQLCYSELEDMSLAFLEHSSPSPVHRSSGSAFTLHASTSSSSSSKHNYPRAILSIDLTGENLSDIDFLEDSTTESLLLSGDEYNQDLDSLAMDDFPDEEETSANEIVRCICEMDEENGFMIQCEECMCWQHSVCMGLLEDSIPDQYICYVCRDPPGQRWSAKYRHDKDWLNKGHMYGLSFLTENYSHQNAKKIMSTHQLLADVYSVKKVLHGLQLKMDILQNKHNPSLHLWARSWVNSDEEQPMGGAPDCIHYREHLSQSSLPETYITSEHSYQKPPTTHEHTEDPGPQSAPHSPPCIPKKEEEEDNGAICLASCITESCSGLADQGHNCLQWQMNLLTHIEDVQNQVAGRMDLIEKELDVLESWLDFTGELEPPDPLGRLPQLKCRIKQLLNDLAKGPLLRTSHHSSPSSYPLLTLQVPHFTCLQSSLCHSDELGRASVQGTMALACLAVLLATSLILSEGKISEYQLESESRSQCELLRAAGAAQQHDHVPQCSEDGRFRHVQCSVAGSECWCVDSEGAELPGSRQNGSAIHCLTSCQLHRQRVLRSGDGAAALLPLCSASGDYQPVQCQPARGQCWCVDQEGMEIYGTRQNGKPARCPGNCEIRERRLLHGVGEPSPPQCSNDGLFLPVQCKLINTTDSMVFDLLHSFNRQPELFQTFSGFKKVFPEISSYCFCADSRGRELPSTGMELLLGEVYDTAFSDMGAGGSFAQSNMYRILQRRFLAVQLAMSGRFRCPTPCESERSAASEADNIFVPSCDANGEYVPTQCQAGGQCWCVGADGKEVFGTRQQGQPDCGSGPRDCGSERRQALSRLLSGPVAIRAGDTQQEGATPISVCSLEFQELLAKSGLLLSLPESDLSDVGDILAELMQGMFPSGALALKALALTPNLKRLQENLFGGKFLKNAGNFNFTGAVGSRGTLSFSQTFSQVGVTLSGPQLEQLSKIFSSDSALARAGVNLDQEITDAFGRSVNLKNNRALMQLLGETLESEHFLATLREAITLLKAEDSSQFGALLQAVFGGSNLDVCQPASELYVPQCDEQGQFEEVQCSGSECWCVDRQGQEVKGSRMVGSRPRCPSQCERERDAAITAKASMSAGAQVFIPKCENSGAYVQRQCLGQSCFCVDRSGSRLSSAAPGTPQQCPTDCQTSAAEAFLRTSHSALSNPSSVFSLSNVYIPRCTSDGSWHHIQCDGPPEQAFDFYREWVQLNNGGKDLPVSELLALLRAYGTNPAVMSSFGGFLSALFEAGHHKVFPMLRSVAMFADLPQEVVQGRMDAVSGPSVFLNPLSMWTLLREGVSHYPGPLSDFSLPLGNLHLRQCWCVSPAGDTVPNTKAALNQAPRCPGSCSLAEQEVTQFLVKAEELISMSNTSHMPVGYGVLLAGGVRLTPQELLLPLPDAPAGAQLSETLLSHSSYSLRLAAHSTLQFYWQTRLMSSGVDKESLLLGYQPYQPQCDIQGQWLSQQCHPSTGQCWCVDEEGQYITASLSSHSTQPLKCPSRCQRAQSLSFLSDWPRPTSDITSSFSPSCDERAGVLSREVGLGFEPECDQEGALFSALQCDQADCWCVSEDSGLELPGTRTQRHAGQVPSCDRPQCPLAFGAASVSHGSVVCHPEQRGQRCEVQCHHGYANVFPSASFLCDPSSKTWLSGAPLSNTCQRFQVFQKLSSSATLQLSLKAGQRSCDTQRSELQSALLRDMRATGLCNIQLSGPSRISDVSVCDESSVSLECVSDDRLKAHFMLTARLSDLPSTAVPDLHDADLALSSERLLAGLLDLIGGLQYQSLLSANQAEASLSEPSFSCAAGYQGIPDGKGCVVCPEGTFSSAAVCSPCPRGTYQERSGQSLCTQCPAGTSTTSQGASSATQCVTPCQQSGMKCSERGDFLYTQQDFLSGRWQCVMPNGQPLPWTSAEEPITEQDCAALRNFDAVPDSQLVFDTQDSILLRSDTVDLPQEKQLRKCIMDCSRDQSCHHVAVYSAEGQTHCDFYSTDRANVECRTSEQTKGFLGNPAAEVYQSLSCSLKLTTDLQSNLIVLRKKGHEFSVVVGQKTFGRLAFRKAGSGVYRTLVVAARGAGLVDAHRFCADICSQETCCDGFILNQNILNGGSLMCGLLSHPDVLLCSEADWDVAGLGQSSRICGAGVQYNKQNNRFTFNFGGQIFNITDTALPASSKNKTDYQASIIGFQRVYIWKETDMSTRSKSSPCASTLSETTSGQLLSDAVLQSFLSLEPSEVQVDPEKAIPSQQYWIFKHQFSLQQTQLWCLQRCEEEELCHMSDLRDGGPEYFLCELFPDTRVCGAYDKPLRQACSLQLSRAPQRAHRKRVDLSGSVESFYTRVPFKKMVSYSVRSRVNLSAKPITEGFFECERHCDEDPCCRGIGYVKDTASPSNPELLCLTLNSLGIQTCGENDRTSWRVQDCSPSKVETQVYPFGWYEKSVNQWTKSPSLCPSFGLRAPSKDVTMLDWKLLDTFAVLVDPSVSTFDVVHISKDIAGNAERVRDWCLAACEESVSCVAVTLESRDSASRCVLYPDTHTCIPTERAQDCRLRVRELASLVYLRTALKQDMSSVVIPGHGQLLGQSVVTAVGSDRKNVWQFLGVPYAQPPVNTLRFSPPQPADWTGSWNATFPRPSCIQPGVNSGTSEDCLHLNVFVPAGRKDHAVLVFFHNPSSSSGLLDGSYLAAVGNIIVVTASFRVSAFGFLSTGSDSLPGNSGLLDQMAALQWVHKNIAQFGGDQRHVTLGAEQNSADIASLHLTSTSTSSMLFHRALLMVPVTPPLFPFSQSLSLCSFS
ncbi:hypothetical protein ACEWY4_003772 [Coilia grayii]|uniref:PHD finger protein 20-like protein 1 n=1 Tax=Coilia grayii TaxID=363190 RepID=A0ABD1KS83_9TELE